MDTASASSSSFDVALDLLILIRRRIFFRFPPCSWQEALTIDFGAGALVSREVSLDGLGMSDVGRDKVLGEVFPCQPPRSLDVVYIPTRCLDNGDMI